MRNETRAHVTNQLSINNQQHWRLDRHNNAMKRRALLVDSTRGIWNNMKMLQTHHHQQQQQLFVPKRNANAVLNAREPVNHNR